MNKTFNTLVELCRHRGRENAELRAYTYLIDGEEEEVSMSFGGLHRWAVTIAQQLQRHAAPGERALLLFPPGLEYIQAFFACLYAGLVAVPAYPPDPNRLDRTLPRLLAIIKDSGAKVILTTEMIQTMAGFLTAQAPELAQLQWVVTDTLSLKAGDEWKGPEVKGEDLAFLQYTSGSTGQPKGVMLSHQNLMANLHAIQNHFGNVPGAQGVTWLPPYHDMGLIGDIMGGLYGGCHMTILSPLHFLQKPLRWLRAISRFKADISGGPNFAYQLCLRKVTAEDRKNLDLSTWEQAYCGAEPIARETLEQFADAFAPCGFRREFLYPCYGLAEATLLAAGNQRARGFRTLEVSKKTFQQRQVAQTPEPDEEALTYVACGRAMPGQQIKIVRPNTLEICPEGEVGEIWLSGPSIAQGYWNQPDVSQAMFGGSLKGDPARRYLRTGDLGFLENGQLYVTGRIKDLIIIRGSNHYPYDIERSVEACHPAIRPGCVAAFSVPMGYEEKLVLVLEVDMARGGAGAVDTSSSQEIAQQVVAAVGRDFELDVHAVGLMAKGALPKTSSGKLQRAAVREGFLKNTLDLVYEWRREAGKTSAAPSLSAPPKVETKQGPPKSDIPPTPENIRPWLIAQVTQHLGISSEEFDPNKPFSDYGLASKDAVELSGDLGDWLGSRFSPALLWKYPSVDTLAEYLGQTPVETQRVAKQS